MQGSEKTGQASAAINQLEENLSAKTNDAVAQGQHDVHEAKEQASSTASEIYDKATTIAGSTIGLAKV